MKIYITGLPSGYEVEHLARLFYPMAPLTLTPPEPAEDCLWAEKTDTGLRVLVRQGCTMEQLCSRLVRRKRGILHRLEVLGIMLDAPQTAAPAWPEEDAAMLRRCVEQRLTMAQMAAMFGCSVQEIQQQLYAMGILQEDA